MKMKTVIVYIALLVLACKQENIVSPPQKEPDKSSQILLSANNAFILDTDSLFKIEGIVHNTSLLLYRCVRCDTCDTENTAAYTIRKLTRNIDIGPVKISQSEIDSLAPGMPVEKCSCLSDSFCIYHPELCFK